MMATWEPLLEQLVRTRHRDLIAYAHMLTGSRADAEDLVQEALIATFGRGRSLANAIAAESYVRRVIASRFIDTKRRGKVERRVLRTVGANDIEQGAGPDILVEHASDVARALTALTPRERACVVLRFMEHYSVSETAQALGLAEGSVKRYVADGIAKLNAALGTASDADAAEWSRVEAKG
jgi:RNA polymerase sigma factor (sigma-70 family)